MNIQELESTINYFIKNPKEICVQLYLILENESGISIKLADIEEKSENSLKDLIILNLKEIFVSDEALNLLNLSSYDERKNVIYEYDLDEIPKKMSDINKLIQEKNNADKFNFNKDKLIDIKNFYIELGNVNKSLQIFRRNYPVNVYSRDKFMLVKNDSERFTHFEKDILKFDGKIDFFYIGESLFIHNLSILEKFFGFEEIIKKNATDSMVL